MTIILWLHNGNLVMPNGVSTTGNTTTLVIANPQPSDDGVYQCVFNDTVDQWILRRNIILEMLSTYVAVSFSYLQSSDLEYVSIAS